MFFSAFRFSLQSMLGQALTNTTYLFICSFGAKIVMYIDLRPKHKHNICSIVNTIYLKKAHIGYNASYYYFHTLQIAAYMVENMIRTWLLCVKFQIRFSILHVFQFYNFLLLIHFMYIFVIIKMGCSTLNTTSLV